MISKKRGLNEDFNRNKNRNILVLKKEEINFRSARRVKKTKKERNRCSITLVGEHKYQNSRVD